MATKATINKALLNIANMDLHYYAEHNLTLAQHPSETDFRLMVRLLAFVFNAHEDLAFSKGISQDDEPDLWQKDLSDDILLWIDLGQPDIKRIKKACGRAEKVIIYTYQEGMARPWWKGIQTLVTRFDNLSVIFLDIEGDIETLAKRAMNFQANIFDKELTLSDEEQNIIVKEEIWM